VLHDGEPARKPQDCECKSDGALDPGRMSAAVLPQRPQAPQPNRSFGVGRPEIVGPPISLPSLSRGAAMFSPPAPNAMSSRVIPTPDPALLDCLDQGHAFAPPMTGCDHHNLGGRPRHFNLDAGRIAWRK
jgi:hypothetical protein